MTRCPECRHLQDYLDGDLPAAQAVACRAHLAVCRECAVEMASLQSVIAMLERAPLPVPRSGLTGRILEQVLPSRVRRRRLVVLGWGYAAALSACVGMVALWVSQPGRHVLIETLSGRLSHQLLGVVLFVLNTFGSSATRLADGWGWLDALGARLAPLSRALAVVLAEPDIGLAACAAAAVCAALFWWMRPRPRPAVREVSHVSVLGF